MKLKNKKKNPRKRENLVKIVDRSILKYDARGVALGTKDGDLLGAIRFFFL